MPMNEKTFYAIVIAIVVVGGIGIGIAYEHPTSVSSGSSATPGPYHLTLAVFPHLVYNSTQTNEPAFFVISNGTLQSSANITVPSHVLIDLTIIDYDSGPGTGTPSSYLNVTGTVGNVVYLTNRTLATGGTTAVGTNNITVLGNTTMKISTMSINDIAHTFTVSGLDGTGHDLNIPVGHGVEFTQFYANNTGKYSWICHVPCGPAAMSTMGWMMGTFYVS
jgi:heme/copper-type cytochrome/quinol oxidase subunit 2